MQKTWVLKNDQLEVHIDHPLHGYRFSRFDWMGKIREVRFKGMLMTTSELMEETSESGVGLYNEFGIEQAIGFDEAQEGDYFHKIGVGLLQKDSDDYSFVLRPLPEAEVQQSQVEAVPPLMVITSGSDVVVARMASVDDAVAHALSTGKSALALRRALRHRRELRRFEPSDIVNHYLSSILRLPDADHQDDTAEAPHELSLRRLKLAVDAMPIILGGHIDLWERWARQFEAIPGGLLMLRERIPVRGEV